MSHAKVQSLLVPIIVVLVSVLVFQSVNVTVQADTAITPTLSAKAWTYLPFVRGPGQAPPATATLPGPTATATPTGTPTNTPDPGRLAAPTLFSIQNDDNDGNFTVSWSTVQDVEFYKLEQKRNNNSWILVYEGPLQSLARSNMSDGQYCYRVMAANATSTSEWSASKCTNVSSEPSTPTLTSTPEVPAPILYNINNPGGGNDFIVQWSAVSDAVDYRLRQNINSSSAWVQESITDRIQVSVEAT